jgi:hypothetical protein
VDHTPVCLCLKVQLKALTVYSVAHDGWFVASTWSTGQIPTAPDTIIIKHYVTFTQNLTIAAPTTLIIDSTGTLCGNYDLINSCGSFIYNYGEIYVKSATIRDMKNYRKFWSKNFITVYGCSLPGYGTGYYNIPPNGTTYVWPEVPCKTKFTNWFEEIGVREIFDSHRIAVFPNPFTDEIMLKEENDFNKIILTDIRGKIVIESSERKLITKNLAAGIYFLHLYTQSGRFTAKLVKLD